MSRHSPLRRTTLKTLAALLPAAAFGPAWSQDKPTTVRIGYQKSSTLITILKTRGTLESRLAPLGVKVSWHEFASGLPLLEALNVGSIDVSADVADTVPVFALAAGANLTYIAQEAPSPTAQAIVVKADSPIRTVADLKGKRIGFAKAAGVHYLLIAALEKAGLTFKDITPAYLAPADGRAAFERDSIDAWVVWDPFLSAVQRQAGARVLADGTDLAQYQRYYLAATPFAQSRSDVIKVIHDALSETGKWVKQTPKDAASLLAPVWGLDEATVEQANGRRSYDVRLVQPERLQEQQAIADTFTREGLLPRKVNAVAVPIWKPAL
ncbi:aliphatic sulfonate ABC transporter substrate-binding protein [Methyloversatilis sp.]|uniref:aliphatic sulfonate ABC transporter substrate-binding protein n=1 Tax=Methyloversatilis sp. TaxID=2569862 RepID=UPI0027BAD6A4|nr:aliphatic sulfonate ABC transporter substrate-binding protein [Methyloversatilis sp.]